MGGTVLGQIFSADTEDEVYSTLYYPDGVTAQLSVNWSDESYRKMSTKVTLWGTKGRIVVDRQECQVFLRDTATAPEGYVHGWNVHYTTDLTPPVWFYVRGEEYSAELDHFVRSVAARTSGQPDVAARDLNSFASAAVTDRVIELMIHDAASPAARTTAAALATDSAPLSSRIAPEAEKLRRRARVKAHRVRAWARGRLAERKAQREQGVPHEHRRGEGDHGSAAVRGQPVLRRQPHVRGEGAGPGHALPGLRQDDGRSRHRLRRGHPYVHVHHARAHRRGRRPGARGAGALPRLRLLPVHALRPQVRQRRHRARRRRCRTPVPARRGAAVDRHPRWQGVREEGRRGHDHACSSTPR